MLSHPFIYQVLNFFGFGENFKKWVKLLCTNRKACITLEGGKVSRTFNLLRGNAQGDILSPFIFILCYQILIFKIQFDLQIIGFVSSPVAEGHSSVNCLPAEAIYITWFTMARQLETSRSPERGATISTACRPSRAFSESIFGSSPSGGTAPDKLYASVATATIWPQAPARNTCKNRNNRMNVWRTVSLMDMSDDKNFIANFETSKQQAHKTISLLELPNPGTDNTGSLTPHKLPNLEGCEHNNIGMDTSNITSTPTSVENSTTKLSTNYYQTRTA